MINPTEYRVFLQNVQKGDQLVFSESYDNNWQMVFADGKKSNAVVYENIFNRFQLSAAGDYAVTILYKPQEVINKGLLISLFTAVISILLIFVLDLLTEKRKEDTRRKLFPKLDQEVAPAYLTQFAVTESYIQNKVVLDVGCWSGQLAQLLVTRAKKVKGIDPGEEAIALAKRKVPQGDFVVGIAEKLPYSSQSFDVVICFEVLEHLPKGNEPLALKEMYRVLKLGGYLLLSTPHKNTASILFDPAFFLLGHRHYSYEQLKSLFEEAGFTIEKTLRKFGFYTGITLNISLLAKHLLRKKITFPSFITKKLIEEGKKDGFLGIYVIAKK